jgi:diguanylate cyclase (GGDEF)-like protein
LQQDVFVAETRAGISQAGLLLEANERLVLATLRAQTDTETATRELNEVSRSAELDTLTQLPNRVLLLDRFAQAIADAKRHHTRLALLFLDLNNFKQINDTFGHAVGDEVLKLAAHCLTSSVRKADTVSRHGGDEFLILLTEMSNVADAIHVADKVIEALGAPSRVGGHVLRLAASIGISIYPDDGEDADTLIARADAAMFNAKRQGLGSFVFHGEEAPSERNVPAPELPSLQRPLTQHEQTLTEHEQTLTEHEHRHTQLREANGELVMAALSAQDLQSAAEQAHQQQMEFLAVLAHELRNPLTPIRTAAALLGRVRADDLPRVQAMIERQVAHMSRLVSDLLDISRVNTGKLTLERRTVDVASIIDAAADACRPAMDARSQRFEVQMPSRPIEVHGDAIRLTQVLSNLLDNASKHTPDDGEIALSVGVEGDAIVMTVSDNGTGIAAEVLPNVFEPFVQDTHAIGFNGTGLGLGLTVVRELVEAHGGKVVANSAGSGLGSQFVVTLPLHRTPTVPKM